MKKYKEYIISPLITIGIVLIVFAIKGVYPFGNLTIASGDMGQAYMTFYYFLYDMVKSGKSIFYDYVLGMGSNMYGGFMVDGLLNPSVFVIFLNTRENIPYMFSFVLIIKLAFIALTSYILFNKLNKENKFYNVIFSVLYAMSGYVLSYHTNIMWLDVVGLFPLFILATDYMFKTNKVHWYAIILALMLIFNYNLAYMVLMFIIFVIPIYIRFGIEKENRKKATFNLIIGTVLSVGLSAFSFIPSFIQVMQSYRMSGTVTNVVTNQNVLYKIVVFIFYSLPLYGYIKWFKYHKEDKKNFLMINLALIFSAIIPILFERVNLLWHTGSYQMFPFRYGFIPTMILYLGALRYFGNFEKNEQKNENKSKWIIGIDIFFTILVICAGIFIAFLINISMPAFVMKIELFIFIAIVCFFILAVLWSIGDIKKEKLKKGLICALTLFQVLIYTYAYIGVPKEYRYGIEWSDDQIFLSNEINNKINNEIKNNKNNKNKEDSLYRLKDLTASTTENCSLVYNVPSMATFLHIISSDQVLNCEQLGYSHNITKLNDFGGTIVSDAIYGIKYVLSKDEFSNELYNYVGEIEDIKIYEYKNVLPIGILYDNEVEKIPEEYKEFDAQNYLYKNLFNKEDNIIDVINDANVEKITNNKYKCTFDIKESKELYIYMYYNKDEKKKNIKNIKVNGKDIIIPTTSNKENKEYPTSKVNGIFDLGYFENQTVEIEFESEQDITANDFKLGLLDIEKYNQIFVENKNENENDNKNNISIDVSGNKIKINGYVEKDINLLIPVNYDKGWKIVNSEEQIKKVYNNFMGIKLHQGENNIEMNFKPYLFDKCVIVTIATIVLMVLAFFIQKIFDIRNIKFIMFVFWIVGILIYFAAIFKFYIMSIIQTILGFFM